VFSLASILTGAAYGPLLLATESSDDTTGNLLGLLLPLLIIGGLFYFLLIMPQRRMRRQAEEMRSALSVGDEVRTVGGIFGTVVSVEDETLELDVGGGTRITLATRAVAQIITDRDDEADLSGDNGEGDDA
jgi:preprotein translocase subunit YajC